MGDVVVKGLESVVVSGPPLVALEQSGADLVVDGFDLAESHTNPTGVWADASTVWVAHDGGADSEIFAYDRATGSQVTASAVDILGSAGNEDPQGIWSDGVVMFVVDAEDAKIYAYQRDADGVWQRAAGSDVALFVGTVG